MTTGSCVSPQTMEVYWAAGSACSTYSDLTGSFNNVNAPEETKMTGTVYNFSDTSPCIGYGKHEPVEVEFEFVYTSDAADAFQTLYPYWTNDSYICVQWHPEGSGAGSSFTAVGQITSWVHPGGAADSADGIVCGMSIMTDEIDVA